MANSPLAIEHRWTTAEYRRLPGLVVEGDTPEDVLPRGILPEGILPSTARRDRSQELRAHHQAGAPWYWPAASELLLITGCRPTPDGYLANRTAAEDFVPALFPGLTLRLAGSFAERNAEEEPHE